MVVADGKPSFNIVLQGASRGVLVIEEETHDAVGAADGDVIGVEIGSPNRAGKHLRHNNAVHHDDSKESILKTHPLCEFCRIPELVCVLEAAQGTKMVSDGAQ